MNFLKLHPTLRIRIGVGFVNRLLDSMITSFMAIYLAFRFGIAVAGVLMFAVVSLGVIGMLVGGHISDTRGRRNTLLLAEFGGFASFALMAGANAANATLVVYAGYLVNKFAASLALPANDAMIVDVTTPEDRKQVYTMNYWATNLALAIGGLLGGFLYNGHFTLLLGGAAVCTAGVCAVTYFLIAESKPESSSVTPRASVLREFAAGYRLVLRDGLFIRFMIAATLLMAIEFQLVNYVGVRLAHDMPNGVEILGILRAENTALVVVLALFSHLLFRRLSDKVRLFAGVGLFTAGYMVLAVSNTGWVLLIAGAVFTVGELMNVPVKQAMLANMVPDQARTRYMAVYNLNIRVAQMLAAGCITLGALVPPWGIALLYGTAGVVVIAQYRVLLARTAVAPEPVPA
ncbi:MFS transporter [Amycolatopsis sp. NPDC059657]|uniref:MFS transporter n=1 Tax=Amycolatopsis sp. NPDC059657 TaxID=3346899 RepID=UPI00366E009E